jgi:hypothetical protein
MNPITNGELARLRSAELRRGSKQRWPQAERPSRSKRRVKRPRGYAEVSPDFFTWVLSLPWVVERPFELSPGVRSFAIDCAPLGLRRLWMVTGFGADSSDARRISVILPDHAARAVENAGWGRPIAKMPAGHVLVGIASDSDSTVVDVEALVLTGYRYAMA